MTPDLKAYIEEARQQWHVERAEKERLDEIARSANWDAWQQGDKRDEKHTEYQRRKKLRDLGKQFNITDVQQLENSRGTSTASK